MKTEGENFFWKSCTAFSGDFLEEYVLTMFRIEARFRFKNRVNGKPDNFDTPKGLLTNNGETIAAEFCDPIVTRTNAPYNIFFP